MATRKPSLDTLGELILEKRGSMGVRAAAREIGISPATLSRVERGHLPALENFRLICRWLEIDPNRILGFPSAQDAAGSEERVRASVHFRKQRTTSQKTAAALARLILHVQRAILAQETE